jgi:hypothetical protein
MAASVRRLTDDEAAAIKANPPTCPIQHCYQVGPLADEPEFNAETLDATSDAEAGRNLKRYASPEEMFEDLGI